ncbi:hypothetical protein SEUCBS139899_006909 [Sporothrix eucalyptigena]|uniref:Transmembrane protein n=1 Tax=Sporothrix eucalyptigena TaxID=1812306 RepID=A0ABP0AYG5_9PEZI
MSSPAGIPFQPSPAHPANAQVVDSAGSFAFWFGFVQSTGSLVMGLIVGTFTNIVWAGAYLIRALTFVLTGIYVVAAWPIARALVLLRFLLSPVTYTLSYVFAPVVSFVYFLGQLRPLYTYLGSAAFVGIVAGLVLKFASSNFFVVLRLDENANAEKSDDDQEEDVAEPSSSRAQLQHERPPKAPRQLRTISQPALLPSQTAYTSPAGLPPPIIKTEDAILTPQDDVWQWLEEFNPKQPAVAMEPDALDTAVLLQKQSSQPGGLLSLTILEESSSE